MMRKPSVCIVAPYYIASLPRVVKEADALHKAGFSVHVVHAAGGLHETRRHGNELLDERKWSDSVVRWAPDRSGERSTYWKSTIYQRIARWLPRSAWSHVPVPQLRERRIYLETARLAAQEPADLYIGHYPAGLAAAAYAAKQYGAKLGYDAEDYHVGQQPDNTERIERIDFIERRCLSRCSHVTAASDGIADALSDRYSIDRPVVIYNMFPWSDRDSIDGKVKDRKGDALSLYWYSQRVGLKRGLEDAIRAIGLLEFPTQLHIRGTLTSEVRATLLRMAEKSGVSNNLYFHDKVPPNELLSRAVEHDIGLALEQGHTPNRALCMTNKLFFYPLAELAVAATDVPGQRTLLEGLDAFSGMYSPGDHQALMSVIKRWTNESQLERAKEAALKVACTQWNWETESQKFVEAVESSLRATPRKDTGEDTVGLNT